MFAAHQIGAALASVGAGYIRDLTSDYTMAWLGAAALCAVAALMSLGIRKVPGPGLRRALILGPWRSSAMIDVRRQALCDSPVSRWRSMAGQPVDGRQSAEYPRQDDLCQARRCARNGGSGGKGALAMTQYVYDFTQGDKDQKDLLGGKGANLAEMTKLGLAGSAGIHHHHRGLPGVPDAGRRARRTARPGHHGAASAGGQHRPPARRSARPAAGECPFRREVLDARDDGDGAEHRPQRRQRQGARGGISGDERFAWDSYRRLLQMFGKTVLEMPGEVFSDALDKAKSAKGVSSDLELDVDDLKGLVDTFKDAVREHSGHEFPQHPREQLDMAIHAVFDSWNTDRARLYRRRERIPQNLGTAVNICTMVFGNLGDTSGTGVAFTRDPASGQTGAYGDYLSNAQGEDVVAGIRNTLSLDDLRTLDPTSHKQLTQVMRRLETHYRDLCDIEFTIERGKLWMLQTRVGKRTAAAAFRIAAQLVDEQLITMDEALSRVSGSQLAQLMFPQFDRSGRPGPADQGHGGIAGRRGRPGGLRLTDREGVGRPRRTGRAGPQGDQPGRSRGHDRGQRHPHRARRKDHARSGCRPRHGQDLRLRGRGAGRGFRGQDRPGRFDGDQRGRRDQHRRIDR